MGISSRIDQFERDVTRIDHRIASVLILANPTAGGFDRGRLDRIAEGLRKAGVEASIVCTNYAGEIADILSNGCRHDAVAIHGGDGTIREAVTALHALPVARRPALVVIPGGTANVIACELSLPHRAGEIVDLIVGGRRRPLYYALANGRPFFLMASAGVDAAIVHSVSPKAKRRFGKLAFIAAAISILRRPRMPDVIIEAGGKRQRARLAVVTNAACYGGPHLLARTTSADRPGLSLIRVKRDDLASLLRIGWTMVAHTRKASALTREAQVGRVRLSGDAPIPVQVDGDAFGMTPVEIEPVEQPLTVLVPAASAANRTRLGPDPISGPMI